MTRGQSPTRHLYFAESPTSLTGVDIETRLFRLSAPALVDDPDILGAFAAGFVNPYASGYSADVIACWVILAIWIVFEARSRSVKHGWLCLVVGILPGVAVGFAAYLVLRSSQITEHPARGT